MNLHWMFGWFWICCDIRCVAITLSFVSTMTSTGELCNEQHCGRRLPSNNTQGSVSTKELSVLYTEYPYLKQTIGNLKHFCELYPVLSLATRQDTGTMSKLSLSTLPEPVQHSTYRVTTKAATKWQRLPLHPHRTAKRNDGRQLWPWRPPVGWTRQRQHRQQRFRESSTRETFTDTALQRQLGTIAVELFHWRINHTRDIDLPNHVVDGGLGTVEEWQDQEAQLQVEITLRIRSSRGFLPGGLI